MAVEKLVFGSCHPSPKSEENYPITGKECLALVWATKKFRPFIWDQKVKKVTDHHAMCWLLTNKDLQYGWLVRVC